MSEASHEPSAHELAHDALRELMNIGSGSALTALSELLDGRRLDAGLSAVELVSGDLSAEALLRRADAPTHGAKLSVAVVSPDRARLSYRFAVLLDDDAAAILPGLLFANLRTPGDTPSASALAEMGNIVASAFLNAASLVLGANLMPSPPAVNVGELASLLRREVGGHTDERPVIVMRTPFSCADGPFSGQLLLCVEAASAVAMLEQMGLQNAGLATFGHAPH